MKIFSVALVAGLLILGGCSEKAAVNKAEAALHVATAKEPTPEEKLAVTKKKADAGDAVAQNELGDMYGYGVGLPKDLTKAVEWYQKAAAQGNADAQFTLGWWYAMGDGLPKDLVKAVEWYQKAAAQGHAGAQHNLVAYIKVDNRPFPSPLNELALCCQDGLSIVVRDFIESKDFAAMKKTVGSQAACPRAR